MEVKRVLSWFENGQLIRPRANHDIPDAVELIRAIAHLCGAHDLELSRKSQQLVQRIGPAEHYVFVVIDGLGLQLLTDTIDSGFLLDHLSGELQAVFPSTTAAALTAFATGAYPAAHGVPGWWSYVDEHNLTAVSLPFIERYTGKPLQALGVRREDIFELPSLLKRFQYDIRTVNLRDFAGSVFSTYAAGDREQIAYTTVEDGVDRVARRVREADRPSYTHFYVPQLDSLCHRCGVCDSRIHDLLRMIDNEMARLHEQIDGRARLVISADHGHVNVAPGKVLVLEADSSLLDDLLCPPTGDGSVPIFHVKPQRHEHFQENFCERYGEHFALLTRDEVEEMRLLGPEPLSPRARRRFGDYIGIAPVPTTLHYQYSEQHPTLPGIHSGLRPGEMRIPLILG